jgi:hypothetical protein
MHMEVNGFSHRQALFTLTFLIDISGANVAFTSKSLTLSKKEIFKYIGYPKLEPVVRLDGKPLPAGIPKELVRKFECTALWGDEDEEDIRLLDWGQAFVQGQEPAKLAQPRGLWPPETIFTKELDYRVDLWRAGATVRSVVQLSQTPANITRYIHLFLDKSLSYVLGTSIFTWYI